MRPVGWSGPGPAGLVAVVGGGNSAGQAALFLAAQSPAVYLVVRGADLTTDMSRYLIDQLEHHDRVHIVLNAEVVGLSGERRWPALTWSTTASENTPTSKPRALFVFIVASGNTLIVA